MSFPAAAEYQSRFRRRISTRDEHVVYRRSTSRGDSRESSRDSSRGQRSRNRDVELTTIQGIKTIEIRSKYLLDAIERVNKHPPLQPTKDCFTEQEPYPTLFHHMDDVKREIDQLSNQDADDHLKALLDVIGYIDPVWNEAREENFPNGLVSYNMIWKLFRPGDLVLREDEIGNLWLFVLIQATYSIDASQSRYTEAIEEDKKAVFKTWSLTWNEADGCLMRKNNTIFSCADFSGQRHIKSLPVYPIRYQEDIKGENTEQFLAKRGRKWWNLIAEPAICQQHSGLAFSQGSRHMDSEKSRVCCSSLYM